MTRIVVVGCGVVGAAIAYELSQQPHLSVTVLDQQPPGHGATAAALGIAVGVISQKAKGRNWRLREASIRRYATLLPELEAATGKPVPHNAQGILSLCFDEAALSRWVSLQAIRQRQGWPLELWSAEEVRDRCPHIDTRRVVVGIYSPKDLQIAPKALAESLVTAALQQGATGHFDSPVVDFGRQGTRITHVITGCAEYPADWVVLTAGLGSTTLTAQLGATLPLVPVLGQGIRVRVSQTVGRPEFQPIISGDDVHLVPFGDHEYGVAATVEFPAVGAAHPQPQAEALEQVWQGAIAFCPALAHSTRLETWYGLRPRPSDQAAPVIQPLAPWTNVILATGHYRNGVLLAPATAETVRRLITA